MIRPFYARTKLVPHMGCLMVRYAHYPRNPGFASSTPRVPHYRVDKFSSSAAQRFRLLMVAHIQIIVDIVIGRLDTLALQTRLDILFLKIPIQFLQFPSMTPNFPRYPHLRHAQSGECS